jgi:Domain of unknown function (DUF4188)
MALIFSGRHAAQSDQAVVVFPVAIGVNKIFALGRWPRETAAMPPMMAELKPDLSRGPFDAPFFNDWRGAGALQCWRSFDPVRVSVHARNAAHLRAGRQFNHPTGGKGSVGIWHQSSTVARGQYVAANRPHSDLAAAELLPQTGRLDTARSRISRSKPAEDPTEQP